jgi:hypothetical protein
MMSAPEMDAMAADAKTRAILAREHMRADRAVSASPDRIRQRRPRRRAAGGNLFSEVPQDRDRTAVPSA